MKKCLCLLCLACGIWSSTAAPFQNLGFDDANTNNLIFSDPGFQLGWTSNLLPGWHANFEPTIGLDTFAAGFGYQTIVSSNGSQLYNNLAGLGYPVTGPYHLLMVPPLDSSSRVIPDIIFQVGDIPGDANSLHFFTYGSPFELRVNGSLVPLFYNQLPGTFGPNLHAATVDANISAYQGMNVELRFTTVGIPLVANYYGLDGISFSPEVVPEPGVSGLFALGSLLLSWRLRHKRR